MGLALISCYSKSAFLRILQHGMSFFVPLFEYLIIISSHYPFVCVHKHTHTLSLSHTHTHTHTPACFFNAQTRVSTFTC